MIVTCPRKRLLAGVALLAVLATACARTESGPATQPTVVETSTTAAMPVRRPGNYLLAATQLSDRTLATLREVDEFRGVSVVYNWVDLETDRGVYDFSGIEGDLALLRPLGKQMMIMIRDKSFANDQFVPVPEYLISEEYDGGFLEVPGRVSVAKRWNPAVSERFGALIAELGSVIGDVAELEGVKMSESAVARSPGPGFTAAGYATQLKLTADALAAAFPGKTNFLYLNWGLNGRLPDGTSLMQDVAMYAARVGVGIGGPDVHPDVAIPAYPLYPMVAEMVPTMVEVQYSDYDHTVIPGDTEELFDFAVNELDVSYIAWKERKPFVDAMIATVRAHPSLTG